MAVSLCCGEQQEGPQTDEEAETGSEHGVRGGEVNGEPGS